MMHTYVSVCICIAATISIQLNSNFRKSHISVYLVLAYRSLSLALSLSIYASPITVLRLYTLCTYLFLDLAGFVSTACMPTHIFSDFSICLPNAINSSYCIVSNAHTHTQTHIYIHTFTYTYI